MLYFVIQLSVLMVEVGLVMGLGNVVVFEGSELVFFFVDLLHAVHVV